MPVYNFYIINKNNNLQTKIHWDQTLLTGTPPV
jgi:hypothetical protein